MPLPSRTQFGGNLMPAKEYTKQHANVQQLIFANLLRDITCYSALKFKLALQAVRCKSVGGRVNGG